MIKKQPEIDIKPNKVDLLILRAGWILVALNFLLIGLFYIDLPDEIPIHFNVKGEADGFGAKINIWVLAVVSLAIYSIIVFIIKKFKPWQMNYPVRVTNKNAPKLYGMNLRMLAILNFGIVLLFFTITLETILIVVKNMKMNLGPTTGIIILFITMLPFYYIFKMFKLQKK